MLILADKGSLIFSDPENLVSEIGVNRVIRARFCYNSV